MKIRTLLSLIALAFASVMPVPDVLADPVSGAQLEETVSGKELPEDKAELRRLLEVLEKHTKITTKTKLNADFVPGMVTVLYGDDLEVRGVRTVEEALALVPGVELSMGSEGNRLALMRGVGRTFASGNTKFLLNSISMNIDLTASATSVLELPVEQVDRIEIIRGPGSAIHGEFAYAGVINVITRRQCNRVFASLGSYDTWGGGGLLSWSSREKELNLDLNLAGWETDGADVNAGPDILYGMGMGAISNAPGPSNEDRDFRSGFFTLGYRSFSLIAQFLEKGSGDHFGVNHVLPFPEDRIVGEQEHRIVEARQSLELSPSLQADLRIGWLEYKSEDDKHLVYPPGFIGIYPDGMVGSVYYEERRFDGGVDLNWEVGERHTLLLGWSFAKTKLEDAWQETNYVPSTSAPLPSIQHFDGTENWIAEGKDRLLNSVTLQDEFRFSRMFTITAGLRYDHYDDVGESLTPRLAGVWRITRHHILKAQYAQAFRPPTFMEMYIMNNPILTGNPDIEPAIINTSELGYIYRGDHTVGRVTIFYSDLDGLIIVDNGTYANSGGARLKGVELELEQGLGRFLKLDANLSYTDTEDLDTGEQIAGAANWLANLGLMYQPRSNLTLDVQYRYVGDRNRDPLDTRDDLDGYNTVDLTGSVFNLGLRGLTLRAGIKNLFDEDVRYPAPLGSDLLGNPIPTYPEDYPRPGRQWWMQISYKF